MRRRLLTATLAVAVGAVLLLGVPLVAALSRLELDRAGQQVSRDAALVVSGLRYRLEAGKPADPGAIARTLPGRYVVVRLGTGPAVTVGRRPSRLHDVAYRVVSGPIDVTVEAGVSAAGNGLAGGLLLMGSLGLLAIGVAASLAVLLSRRLAVPLVELAEVAAKLGSGDLRRFGRRYGMRELDRVAEGLDRSFARVTDLLAAEREFAMDASHQLRTPLTALSMRLEEMIAAADEPDVVRQEGVAALAQAERLTNVVSHLLGRTIQLPPGATDLTSIDEVVGQQLAEWGPAFRRAGRMLDVAGVTGLRALAAPANVAQVIATLLENALVHGGGTVGIRTWQTAQSIVVEVGDEGRGVPPELAATIFERNVSGCLGGTGLGLSLARGIAAADGGRVVLVQPRPAVFALYLPRTGPHEKGRPRAASGPA